MRETSHYLEALTRNGVIIDRCFITATKIRAFAASIFIDICPEVHLNYQRQEILSIPVRRARLREELRARDFKKAVFCTTGRIGSDIAFDRGFSTCDDVSRDSAILVKRRKLDPSHVELTHTS